MIAFLASLHCVSSYRWLHLMDGSPNAGGQPPINSLRPPNIIVSHFLKRRPFDLVSQCTCTLAGPDGSSDLRMIIKTGCCRRWKLSRRPEIIPNKSSSYRRPAQIYRSPLNLPRLNQWFQGSRAKKIGQIFGKNSGINFFHSRLVFHPREVQIKSGINLYIVLALIFVENMESGPVASLDLKYSYISVSISVSKDSLIVRLRHPVCLLPSQWIRKSGDDCHWITIKSLYFIQYINIKTSEWIQSLFCGRMLISCTLNLTERDCHLRGFPT